MILSRHDSVLFCFIGNGYGTVSWTPPRVRLGYWRFNTAAMTNEAGVAPTERTNLAQVPDWSGYAVSLTNTNSALYYPFNSGSTNYFNPSNGTVRYWFQASWSSTMTSSPPAPGGLCFFEANDNAGDAWSLTAGYDYGGTNGLFDYSSTGTGTGYVDSDGPFKSGVFNGLLLNFKANLWYQLAFTYSPTNVALYTNGVLLGTGSWPPVVVSNGIPLYDVGVGNVFYPLASALSNTQFSIGCGLNALNQVFGQLDELETFNYAMTAQQVAAGFPFFGGNATNALDSYYVGRSDMLQTYVDGAFPPVGGSAARCRLGYWRFDSPLLYAEQGQMPLSQNNVGLAPSWSGTALVVSNAANSQITYPDVGWNGWADINCQQGTLRFWFKPNSTPASNSAPFVYMGTTNGSDEWALWIDATGSNISFVTASNGTAQTNLHYSYNFPRTNWTQIALTYGSYGSYLYIITGSVKYFTQRHSGQIWHENNV